MSFSITGTRKVKSLLFFHLVHILQEEAEDGTLHEVGLLVRTEEVAPRIVVLVAGPRFVQNRNMAPRFKAKMPGTRRHPQFYSAVNEVGGAPYSESDILSANCTYEGEKITLEDYGTLDKLVIEAGYRLFARGPHVRKQKGVDTPMPADKIVSGIGYLTVSPYVRDAMNRMGQFSVRLFSDRYDIEPTQEGYDAIVDLCWKIADRHEGAPARLLLTVEREEGSALCDISAGHDAVDLQQSLDELHNDLLNNRVAYYRTGLPAIYFDYPTFCKQDSYGNSKLSKQLKEGMALYGLDETSQSLIIDYGNKSGVRRAVYLCPMKVAQTYYRDKDGVERLGNGRSFVFIDGEVEPLSELGMRRVPQSEQPILGSEVGLPPTPQQRQLPDHPFSKPAPSGLPHPTDVNFE